MNAASRRPATHGSTSVVYLDWVRHGQRLYALSEILIFLLILFVGLIYVWVKRDLEWLKKVPE
jgi:hypothetical protein